MKKFVVVLLIAFFLLLPGCSGSGKPALKDGMFLKYDQNVSTPSGGANMTIEYKFNKQSDGKYKVVVTPSGMKLRGKTLPAMKPFEATVNDEMKTDKGDLLLVLVCECPLWIPPNLRKKDAKYYEFKCTDIKKWEKWECCIYEFKSALGDMKVYYDKNTGFFTGAEASPVSGKVEIKLQDTNVEGL